MKIKIPKDYIPYIHPEAIVKENIALNLGSIMFIDYLKEHPELLQK